jgi:hypothetical protein
MHDAARGLRRSPIALIRCNQHGILKNAVRDDALFRAEEYPQADLPRRDSPLLRASQRFSALFGVSRGTFPRRSPNEMIAVVLVALSRFRSRARQALS